MRHTDAECKGVHCRCMNIGGACPNQHYSDHVQANGLTPQEQKIKEAAETKSPLQTLRAIGCYVGLHRYAILPFSAGYENEDGTGKYWPNGFILYFCRDCKTHKQV